MKKILIILMALMAIFPASADTFFSLRSETVTAVNDTLWLYPLIGDPLKYKLYVTAHLDGYIDQWYLNMTHPSAVRVLNEDTMKVDEGPAMSIPYYNTLGVNDTCYATLLTNLLNQQAQNDLLESHFGSVIYTMGYWDPYNTNIYQSYGTVKWAEGDHNYMFSLWLSIPYGRVNTELNLDLTFNSTYDLRNITCINGHSIKNIHIHVGYKRGDVSGNGYLDMVDVVLLQDIVLSNGAGATPYELDAADVDGDGAVTVSDVSELIDIILL